MLSYLAHRAFNLAAALVAASLLVFVVLSVLPGDPAEIMLGVGATPESLAALRAELGLNTSAVIRYFDWIGGVLHADFGQSMTYGVPVAELVLERLQVTVPLAVIAFLMAVAVALPFGVFAAVNRNRPGDYLVMGFSQLGLAVPNFWFGILLILLFAVQLHWFQAGGFAPWEDGWGPALKSLLLPAIALALSEAAILSRVVRSATLDVYREDYVRTARAKGLSNSAVLFRHVLRNMLLPVITIMGLQFAFLIAGAVVVENVFYLPGLGRLILQAIFQRDLVVVQNVILLLAALVVTVNFIVDIAYALIDPRPHGEAHR